VEFFHVFSYQVSLYFLPALASASPLPLLLLLLLLLLPMLMLLMASASAVVHKNLFECISTGHYT